jgi:membrane-bound inhibitor of C-type lysozyme
MMRSGLIMLGLALAACADTDSPEPPAADTTMSTTATPVVIDGDTLLSTESFRCADGRVLRVGSFRGAATRVALNLGDTGLWARATAADTGARYATLDESAIWWHKGDTASLTWQGRITTCVVDSTVVF